MADLPTTLPPYEGENNAQHPREQIHEVFSQREMLRVQIDSIFSTADKDKDGIVSDDEWAAFYEEFVAKFQACDTDKDGKLNAAELSACVASAESGLLLIKNIVGSETQVIHYMDRVDDLTFYEYMFLRRVASAARKCSDNGYFAPDKMYCGLSVTSPRSPVMSASEEK